MQPVPRDRFTGRYVGARPPGLQRQTDFVGVFQWPGSRTPRAGWPTSVSIRVDCWVGVKDWRGRRCFGASLGGAWAGVIRGSWRAGMRMGRRHGRARSIARLGRLGARGRCGRRFVRSWMRWRCRPSRIGESRTGWSTAWFGCGWGWRTARGRGTLAGCRTRHGSIRGGSTWWRYRGSRECWWRVRGAVVGRRWRARCAGAVGG